MGNRTRLRNNLDSGWLCKTLAGEGSDRGVVGLFSCSRIITNYVWGGGDWQMQQDCISARLLRGGGGGGGGDVSKIELHALSSITPRVSTVAELLTYEFRNRRLKWSELHMQ